MADEKIISGNLRLKLDGDTIFHAMNCSLSMSRDFKERATKDTDGVERAKGTKSWTASFDGLAVYAGGTNTLDFADLFALYDDDSDTEIEVEFVPSEWDHRSVWKGLGYIDNLESSFPNDEDGTISLSIVGSGAMTIDEITPPDTEPGTDPDPEP